VKRESLNVTDCRGTARGTLTFHLSRLLKSRPEASSNTLLCLGHSVDKLLLANGLVGRYCGVFVETQSMAT
jgi:hypothetical protein